MNKKIAHIFLGIIITMTLHSCMQEPEIQPNTPRGNFETLWNIIDKRYCYLDYKNINWDAVHTQFSAKIDTVSSNYVLFDLLSDMLDELKDGHVNLFSEFDRSRYWKWYTDFPENFDGDLILNSRYLGDKYRIAGPFRYRKIAGDRVGYAYYGSFSSNFSDGNIKSIFDNFSNCKGIIIDVRNNGGGVVTNAEQLASYFFKEKTLVGYVSHKIGDGHSDFSKPTAVYSEPNEKVKWEKPVVILTNRMSYSATNEFVCRMQYSPFAIIVGDKTGGGGGFPLSSELPNGWMVRFSASPMFDANMQHTEWGLDPDVKVEMSAFEKMRGIDTIIEEAVNQVLSK